MVRFFLNLPRAACTFLYAAMFVALCASGCGSELSNPTPNDDGRNPGTLPSGVDDPASDDPSANSENQPPVADAGADQIVMEGESVTLDGAASSDPDGDELIFLWTSDEVDVANGGSVTITITAPAVDDDTLLTFTLRVDDGQVQSEDMIEVLVRAEIDDTGIGPNADAGPDLAVAAGAFVTLDGTASNSEFGGALVFDWFQAAGPPVSLSDASVSNPSFTAPSDSVAVVLVFELTVHENGLADVDEVTVSVAAAPPPDDITPPPPPPPDDTDNCPNDPNKTQPGICGCDIPDTDSDGDGTPNCNDACPNNAPKTAPGICGCAVPDTDSDGDGTPNCNDGCPTDPNKITPGSCGCGVPQSDSDGDGTPNCIDGCPTNAAKITPGVCGCAVADTDSDGDGMPNCIDGCPADPNKTAGGQCGCGVADTDGDGDGTANCNDGCPNDPSTTDPADCAPLPGGGAQTDWDLVMLRLVNRARVDPAGEAVRLGSSVVDTRSPVPPLAYERPVGQAATNHNTWMHLNLGNIASGRVPDSFTHYETMDGNATGTPATGTPGYTGATLGARMTAAGMSWGSVGENILTIWSGNTIVIDEAKMIQNHRGWWESSGHRNNMLSSNYTSFGHKVEARTFTPPRGGLNSPVDNILFATQNFARPLSTPRNYVFGVLYNDVNASGTWTPRNVGDPQREGLAAVAFTVRVSGTTTVVATDTTMDNGAFAAKVADGTYDIRFTGSSLPGGALTISAVTVSGSNVNAGDWDVNP